MFAAAVLAASLALTPVYLSSGEPIGKSSIAADLEVGFPQTGIWAAYGVNDRIDVGLRVDTLLFKTDTIDLLVRAELWQQERLRISVKLWGGWTQAHDAFSAELLGAEGPWGLGGLLTVS